MNQIRLAGPSPWLPFPFSRWRSWNEPVRAERLAALRIAVGLVMLLDILISHLPQVHDFWGPGSLAPVGDRDLFAATFRERWVWSWLRGLADPLPFAATLTAFAILTARVFAAGCRRRDGAAVSTAPLSRELLAWWAGCAAVALLAVWSYLNALPQANELGGRGRWSALSAGFVWVLATILLALGCRETVRQRRARLGVWAGATAFLLAGIARAHADHADGSPLPFDGLLTAWNDSPDLIMAAMIVWALSAALLMLGAWTRVAAVTAWLLATSFANLNPHMTNHGDYVRTTILFCLMLSPCAATWSLDSRRAQRGQATGPVWVHPWPLRLLMLQLMLIYCFNGLYKALGSSWRLGTSLYYVMADLFLTRMAYAQFPVPVPMLRAMSYVVLVWEMSFPLLVVIPQVRTLVLVIGVLFHLGIGVTLDLGPFQAYMLCLYVPLVPWERWVRDMEIGRAAPVATQHG